mgnify:CR=1 FL=1
MKEENERKKEGTKLTFHLGQRHTYIYTCIHTCIHAYTQTRIYNIYYVEFPPTSSPPRFYTAENLFR